MTFSNVVDGPLDASQAAFPFGIFLEWIHRKESLLEVGNVRKDEVGHQFEVGPHLGDDAIKHDALDAAERMVADHHEAALFGNVLQLFGADINGDVHVLNEMVGKFATLIVGRSIKKAVDFAQAHHAVDHSRDTGAEEAFQAQSVLDILICNDFSHDFNLQK